MIWLLPLVALAEQDCSTAKTHDELRLFVVTVAPGDELWARFGHNAVWVSDGPKDEDLGYSFGTYDSSQQAPLPNFLAGTMNYWLEVEPFDKMMRRYGTRQERTVYIQRLNIPPQSARFITDELARLALPENRSYRYHWADANCSTRIRDLVDEALDGQLANQFHDQETPWTWRREVLRHLGPEPLAWLGWHFAASGFADQRISRWEAMFLPDRLREAIAETRIPGPTGQLQPLSPYECKRAAPLEMAAPEPPQRDAALVGVGVGSGAALAAAGAAGRSRRGGRVLAGVLLAGLGLLAGLAGSLSAVLGAVSVLEGFAGNENLLLACPLALALVPGGLALARGRRPRWLLPLAAGLAVLALVPLLLDLVGRSAQENAGITGLLLPMWLGAALAAWLLAATPRS